MRFPEYERMAEVESRMWWFRNLHHNLLAVIENALGAPLAETLAGKSLLDAGCGTGGVLMRLEAAAPDGIYYGVDIAERAVEFAREKTRAELKIGSVDELPYPDEMFDVIVSADVILHELVNEDLAIAEFRRCLKPGGLLILNMPAYQWLRSYHDENVGGARRYTKAGLRRQMEARGFRTVRATYWNTTFFPLMVAKRKLIPNKGDRSDVALMAGPLESFFHGATLLERCAVRNGYSLPYGGSVMWAGVADKNA